MVADAGEHPSAPPRLALAHSFWALGQMPEPPEHYVQQLRARGFEMIEVGLRSPNIELAQRCRHEYGLTIIGQGWALTADEAKPYIEEAQRLDAWALNMHLGHAYMAARDAADLADGCRKLADAAGLVLLIETHRGRITQDLYRTAEWLTLSPDARITLDLSHYVVAGEGSGGWDAGFRRYLQPIIDRTSMIHARVSDRECVQSDIGPNGQCPIVDRFLEAWTRVMRSWRGRARAGDMFVFEAELGPPPYAQTDLDGRQISDRWTQSLVLADLGRRAWDAAAAPPDA